MANDDEKKPKLANTLLNTYPYGDLNPILVKETSPRIDDDETFFGILKRSARLVHTPDARIGTGPYKGIVLRRNRDITSVDEIPANSWLANFPTRFSANTVLQSYQVYIPELHSHLPRVDTYASFDTDCDEHAKIDLYPTFISKDSDVKPAVEGSIVWVNYANTQTFEDPIYLGPVDGLVGPIDAGACKVSAKKAMKKSCGKPPNAAPGAEATGEVTLPRGEEVEAKVYVKNATDRILPDEPTPEEEQQAQQVQSGKEQLEQIQSETPPTPSLAGEEKIATSTDIKSRKQALLREISKIKKSKKNFKEPEDKEVIIKLDAAIKKMENDIKALNAIKQIKSSEEIRGAAKEKECPDCPKHGDPPTERPTMKKVKVTLDVANYGGRTGGTMTSEAREDVAQAFTKARKIVNELGGVIAGGGGKAGPFGRSLSNFPKEGEKGKSKVSYHYLYKALDMETRCSTNNAHPDDYGKSGASPFKWDVKKIYKQKEYFIVKDGSGLRVWAKSKKPAGTSFGGYRVERKTLRVFMCAPRAKRFKNKGPDTIKITGNFIDLTRVMLDQGFKNISPVDRWWTACGASPRPRAEWWHFHMPEPPETKFGDALLSVYSDEEVQCQEPWRYRNFVLRNGVFKGEKTDKGCA